MQKVILFVKTCCLFARFKFVLAVIKNHIYSGFTLCKNCTSLIKRFYKHNQFNLIFSKIKTCLCVIYGRDLGFVLLEKGSVCENIFAYRVFNFNLINKRRKNYEK